MDLISLQKEKDRISELPDDILLECLSLLEMKNVAQTSIISRRWRYLWCYSTHLDFDPELMYPEEFHTFLSNHKYQTRKYFSWINQVVSIHQGPCIDKFRVHSRYVSSYANQFDKWVKFAFSKRVKELVLDLDGINFICADHSKKGFPLGFDILSHPPCRSGIIALQSLHLRYVNMTENFLEFLLSHCVHLERLYLDTVPLSTIKVKSSKLKYLSILMHCNLEELEIDAENLLYFEYDDANDPDGAPRMVFKRLPMLVETNFRGGFCQYPFPVFEKLSLFSTQLCKLSLNIRREYTFSTVLVIPDGVIPTFPNVKHVTCSTRCYDISCMLSLKRLIKACPMMEEFQLQVAYQPSSSAGFREASELQGIDFEEENAEMEAEFIYDDNLEIGQVREAEAENINEETQSHPNLRILELIGFLGAPCDVQLTLAIVSYACSLKAIICDPRGDRYSGHEKFFCSDTLEEYDVAKMRARKLAKIVAPQVEVVII